MPADTGGPPEDENSSKSDVISMIQLVVLSHIEGCPSHKPVLLSTRVEKCTSSCMKCRFFEIHAWMT